ncbi:MAG: DUF4214 domain-containing protein [Pseudomonadota bacterium]
MDIFMIAEGARGRELYVTDLTPEGTTLLEINLNLDPDFLSEVDGIPDASNAARLGDTLLFAGDSGIEGDVELWRSDGTLQGTQRLVDLNPGDDPSSPEDFKLFEAADVMLFTATTPDSGREIWATDGTAAGTRQLFESREGDNGLFSLFNVGVGNVAWGPEVGGLQYFYLQSATEGAVLWATDGTTEGTRKIQGVFPGFEGGGLQEVNTRFVVNVAAEVNGALVFAAYPPDGAGRLDVAALYSTDGTAAGTRVLTDFGGTEAVSSILPALGPVIDGLLYFATNDSNGQDGPEIWVTDGTTEGTRIVADFAAFAGRASGLTAFEGKLFFRSSNPDGGENGIAVYSLDPATGAIAFLGEGPSRVERDVNGVLYFNGNETGFGEPYASDGTPEGTVTLGDIDFITFSSSEANSFGFFEYQGQTYFEGEAFTGDFTPDGERFFRTDGTPEGTVALPNLLPEDVYGDPVLFLPEIVEDDDNDDDDDDGGQQDDDDDDNDNDDDDDDDDDDDNEDDNDGDSGGGSPLDAAALAAVFEAIAQRAPTAAEAESLTTTTNRNAAITAVLESFAQETKAVATFYQVFYDRVPDLAGLDFWTDTFRDDASFGEAQLATAFFAAGEFDLIYGGLDTRPAVRQIYENVLNRAADPEGENFWVDQIESGAFTLRNLGAAFSLSEETRETFDPLLDGFLRDIGNEQTPEDTLFDYL